MEISDIAPDNLIEVSFHQLIDKMKCASYANEIALLNVKAPFESDQKRYDGDRTLYQR